MASPVVQLRIPADMLAAVDGARGEDNRSAWILSLIERQLLSGDDGGGTAVTSPTCPACRSALEGHTYQREIPPSAGRLMRGAA